MEIESLIQELGLVEDIDYSKIDRYLDKGIYLDNHAILSKIWLDIAILCEVYHLN